MLGTGIFRKAQPPNLAGEIETADRSLTEAKGIVKSKAAELDGLKPTDPGFAHRKVIAETALAEAEARVAAVEKRISRLRAISGDGKLDVQHEIELAEAAVANSADEAESAKRRLADFAQAEAERLVDGGESDADFARRRTILQSELQQARQNNVAAKEHLERLRGLSNSQERKKAVAKNAELRKRFCDEATALLNLFEEGCKRREKLFTIDQEERNAIYSFNQSAKNSGLRKISRQLSASQLWTLLPVFNMDTRNLPTVLKDARQKLEHLRNSGGE